jgi:hypothetical protein
MYNFILYFYIKDFVAKSMLKTKELINIFIPIAIRRMPKILSMIVIPTIPSFSWIQSADFKKMYITAAFRMIPDMITLLLSVFQKKTFYAPWTTT